VYQDVVPEEPSSGFLDGQELSEDVIMKQHLVGTVCHPSSVLPWGAGTGTVHSCRKVCNDFRDMTLPNMKLVMQNMKLYLSVSHFSVMHGRVHLIVLCSTSVGMAKG
jgi:hypothetical protein